MDLHVSSGVSQNHRNLRTMRVPSDCDEDILNCQFASPLRESRDLGEADL